MTPTSQAARQLTLPDFRNLGVMLRILVFAELANLLSFVAHQPDGMAALLRVANWGLLFETAVLGAVLVLFALSPWLARLPYRQGTWAVTAISTSTTAALAVATGFLAGTLAPVGVLTAAVLAAVLAALMLAYFNWRQRVLSPALAEARLMALQSRIRPHFLFNSLNTALALVRQQPRQAEAVLLDMSDLFRVLLAEPRSLVPLAEEIRLARSYLEIEQLRLGERLDVKWSCEGAPLAARVPILLLQPLLENAVRYGVEPATDGGEISVRIDCRGKTVEIDVENEIAAGASGAPAGNRIALANIIERLTLHFDSEASLRTREHGGRFCVQVRLPLLAGGDGDAKTGA